MTIGTAGDFDDGVPAALPARVGVVGGGRMGSGIAHAFAVRGSEVVLVEADASRTDAAFDAVVRALRASVERGTAQAPAGQMIERVSVTTEIAELADVTLAVEAVPEDPALKRSVLAAISSAVAPNAIIASNTSSLSISQLAAAIAAPERFLGMHFFNPVPTSQLVEVVVGRETSAPIVEVAQQVVEAIGKVAVTVADSPGFASSRLGLALGLEAIRMVADGVAAPQDIDAAMVLGYKHPVGPLELTDLVGLDVRLGIADYLASTLGERFSPPSLLRDKVSRGELGRKTGVGFYNWTDGSKGRHDEHTG